MKILGSLDVEKILPSKLSVHVIAVSPTPSTAAEVCDEIAVCAGGRRWGIHSRYVIKYTEHRQFMIFDDMTCFLSRRRKEK